MRESFTVLTVLFLQQILYFGVRFVVARSENPMFRSFLVLAAVTCAMQSTSADAEGPLGRWLGGLRHPNHARGTVGHPHHGETVLLFGKSIGFGSYPAYNYPRPGEFDPERFDNYVHDPYVRGRFDAPDLLNDPYFRERHRYDSHFRGRRYRK